MGTVQELLQGLLLQIKNLGIPSRYLKAGAIVFLLFVLVLALARTRRIFVRWSFKAASAWFFIGFLIALVLEGFLLIGGRTVLTEILGWKNAPKPIQTTLDRGREKMVDVLGIKEEVPFSFATQEIKLEELIEIFQSLEPEEAEEVRSAICSPGQ